MDRRNPTGDVARPTARGCGWHLADAARGVFQGDFAADLGLAGAVAQATLGFVPVFGTLAAARDAVANWRGRDRIGFVLNLLALVPFFGGFAKTAEVARNVQRVGRTILVFRRDRRDRARQ